MKGYPGADCGSDHVPIVANMKVILRATRKRKTVKKLKIDLLRTNNENRKKFPRLTSERINDNEDVECLEGRYGQFRYALTEYAQLVLTVVEKTAKQKWMTAAILQKMGQRRLAKGNEALYNLLGRDIGKDCKAAKKNMLAAQCDVIEQLDTAHNTYLMHSKNRLVTCRKRGSNPTHASKTRKEIS